MITSIRNKEIEKVREELNLSQEKLGKIIGVSTRTIFRWEHNKSKPSGLATERLILLGLVLRKMDGIIRKGKEKEWLNTPLEDLGDKTPLEKIEEGIVGIQEVLNLLGRIEWGVAT